MMGTAFGGLLASIGVAIIITALALPGRQTPAVINSASQGLIGLTHASLGM